MSDRHNSISPPEQVDDTAFRETFLYMVTEPQVKAAFRVVADELYTWLLCHSSEYPEVPESYAKQRLRAIAADMRHLQALLWYETPQDRQGDEQDFSRLGPVWATRLGELAAELEAAIGPSPVPPSA